MGEKNEKWKVIYAISAFIGAVSVLMPWFTWWDMSVNALSEDYNGGYFIGLAFLAILAINIYIVWTKKRIIINL